MLELYTFAISHFSEKARWAFDLEGVPYTERRLLPGIHVPIVRRKAPRTTVPLLTHEGGVVQGSSAILDWLEARLEGRSRLAPNAATRARSTALEALADRSFGLGIQRIAYDTLLDDRETVIGLWTQGAPAWSRIVYRVAYPLIANAVKRTYKISPAVVTEAKDRFRRAMDETDAALATHRYLTGDGGPGRADITVAALLAPLCRPAEHVIAWPAAVDPGTAAFLRELEGRPTLEFVRRMYAEHRPIEVDG